MAFSFPQMFQHSVVSMEQLPKIQIWPFLVDPRTMEDVQI